MFEEMSDISKKDTVRALYNVKVAYKPERERVAEPISTNRGEESIRVPIKRKEQKVGRNDPCPCGSGKKYKFCCGKNA